MKSKVKLSSVGGTMSALPESGERLRRAREDLSMNKFVIFYDATY